MESYDHQSHVDRDERRMPSHAPDWTEENTHDPGVPMLVLFGFLGAGLLWQLPGRREGAWLSRLLWIGLGAASAAWLLRLYGQHSQGQARKSTL